MNGQYSTFYGLTMLCKCGDDVNSSYKFNNLSRYYDFQINNSNYDFLSFNHYLFYFLKYALFGFHFKNLQHH